MFLKKAVKTCRVMKNEEEKSVKHVKVSLPRYFLSYLLIGVITLLPLTLYYIPGIKSWFTVEMELFSIQIGTMRIAPVFDTSLIPTVLSTIIGITSGFIMWCYYTRTRCLAEQVPGSVLLEPLND